MFTNSILSINFLFLENENTLDDSIMSNDKTQGKYSDIHDDLGYPTKGDKYKKKNLQSRVYSSRHNSSRFK